MKPRLQGGMLYLIKETCRCSLGDTPLCTWGCPGLEPQGDPLPGGTLQAPLWMGETEERGKPCSGSSTTKTVSSRLYKSRVFLSVLRSMAIFVVVHYKSDPVNTAPGCIFLNRLYACYSFDPHIPSEGGGHELTEAQRYKYLAQASWGRLEMGVGCPWSVLSVNPSNSGTIILGGDVFAGGLRSNQGRKK